MFGWDQVFTIIGVNAAIVGLVAGWITWVINRVDSDVVGVKGNISKIDSKLDSLIARMDARFESQSARTDKLYEMFVQLLKERK